MQQHVGVQDVVFTSRDVAVVGHATPPWFAVRPAAAAPPPGGISGRPWSAVCRCVRPGGRAHYAKSGGTRIAPRRSFRLLDRQSVSWRMFQPACPTGTGNAKSGGTLIAPRRFFRSSDHRSLFRSVPQTGVQNGLAPCLLPYDSPIRWRLPLPNDAAFAAWPGR